VLPVHQVRAHRVPPAHVTPGITLGVVLVKQVVLPVEKHQPVRVVHPVLLRRKVKLRAEGFVEGPPFIRSPRRGRQQQCEERRGRDAAVGVRHLTQSLARVAGGVNSW
jgi:hypothetical protein